MQSSHEIRVLDMLAIISAVFGLGMILLGLLLSVWTWVLFGGVLFVFGLGLNIKVKKLAANLQKLQLEKGAELTHESAQAESKAQTGSKLVRIPLGLVVLVVSFLCFCPHACDRGIKLLETLAFFFGPAFCTAAIFHSQNVRTGFWRAVGIVACWFIYLTIIHL